MKLVLQNIHLRQGTFVLKLDAEITGQGIGILGPSGAGKTSLLEVIAGLRPSASGVVQIDDVVLMDRERRHVLAPERRGIGYIPQDLALFPHLSVRKNLEYGRKHGVGVAPAQVTATLEIEALLDRSVNELSGGQRQRVAFARALLASPRLLLMDEPLASLDQELKSKIIPYLKRIRDEFHVPMLYVSHSPDELTALCDQVMVMRDGQCRGIYRPNDIFEPATSMTLKPGILE